MSAVSPVPEGVEYFLDTRGDARALRVSWHHEADVVVLSMWRGRECVSSFRLSIDEVPELIAVLRDGLDRSYDAVSRPAGDAATTR
ncbi:hypothetical protein [Nocardioides pocheonensis]|uniref:Uncharacterized protein n=1 Tax=Nocardioides pocheonensis TaxID=661485 RepID=A0A3N0GKP4_9ACTN|nr:hypothetical protein [Nocardioides pocheonensis]RNM12698.1 hypothetical protein EFL26_19065 [Nocardioides pocheonensis]